MPEFWNTQTLQNCLVGEKQNVTIYIIYATYLLLQKLQQALSKLIKKIYKW